MKFYSTVTEMECLAGDTLPSFHVQTDAESLTGCSMQMLLSEWGTPDTAVLTKNCTLDTAGTGFSCQVTSADTAGFAGVFELHFCLTDAGGNKMRKLYAVLTVKPCPQGGD